MPLYRTDQAGSSPLDRTFFGRIDLCQLVRAVEESLHVVEQEALRFRIGEIKTVMINDPGLCLQPFRPARLANFIRDFLPEVGRQWSKTERWPLLSAASAFNFFRHELISPQTDYSRVGFYKIT